jgi:putative PIN family toxin of toxin-antitoxin system
LIKIVVDANLFASALIKPDSNPEQILELIKQNKVDLVISPSAIKEIKRILLYPKIQKYHQKTTQYLIILIFNPQKTNQQKRQYYVGNILDSFLISVFGGLNPIPNWV